MKDLLLSRCVHTRGRVMLNRQEELKCRMRTTSIRINRKRSPRSRIYLEAYQSLSTPYLNSILNIYYDTTPEAPVHWVHRKTRNTAFYNQIFGIRCLEEEGMSANA
jgi:hypothetical protein